MKTLIGLLIAGALTGCISRPVLVNATFKPTRHGIVKIPKHVNPTFAKEARLESMKIMSDFCGDDVAEVISIDKASTATGSRASQFAGVQYSETTYDEDSFVHFDCIARSMAEEAM